MAYQKQTWVTGETITEQKLNHMEDGIANTILIVNANYDESTETATLDKTWQQIHDASYAILSNGAGGLCPIAGIEETGSQYTATFIDIGISETLIFVCDSADGYPTSNNK